MDYDYIRTSIQQTIYISTVEQLKNIATMSH